MRVYTTAILEVSAFVEQGMSKVGFLWLGNKKLLSKMAVTPQSVKVA